MGGRTTAEDLRFLGIDEAAFSVLALLPLVEVAWADGEVQAEERTKILEIASTHYALNNDAKSLLEGWLTHPPSDAYLAKGRLALLHLAQSDPEFTVEAGSLEDVVDFCTAVARAAGGVLGFRSIDQSERAVLNQLAEALSVSIQTAWHLSIGDEDVGDMDTDVYDIVPVLDITESDTGVAQVIDAPALMMDVFDGPPRVHVIEQQLNIGRMRVNDIPLPAEHEVSRLHARVWLDDNRVYIEDNQSANGTFVNGERIKRRRLFGGEEIRVGPQSFRFVTP